VPARKTGKKYAGVDRKKKKKGGTCSGGNPEQKKNWLFHHRGNGANKSREGVKKILASGVGLVREWK